MRHEPTAGRIARWSAAPAFVFWTLLTPFVARSEDAPPATTPRKADAASTDSMNASSTTLSSDVARPALVSGKPEGEHVAQFYSRVVTGPLMNRSTCFVCRFGERPVAMVLMRKIGPEMRPLLKNVDRLVERHRAGGLRGFGVLVSDQAFAAISSVQTFAFNAHVALPLTVGAESIATETCQDLHRDAAVTVVLYHKRKVIERFALRADELDVAHFTPIIDALKTFAAERAARGVPSAAEEGDGDASEPTAGEPLKSADASSPADTAKRAERANQTSSAE